MPTDNSFTRGLKRLGKILGVSFPEDNPEQDQHKDVELSLHTPTEMRYLPGIYSPDGSHTEQLPSTSEFLDQLLGISQQAGNWSRTAQSFGVLAPELKDAADIWVSSVISPTDLQTNSIQILLEKTDLGQDIEDKISSELTEFFNGTFELAPRMKTWMKKAIFQDGASPILIVPQVNIDTLNAAVDIDETKAGHDVKEIIKNANHPQMNQQMIPGNFTMGSERLEYDNVPPMMYDAKDASMELLIPTIRPTEGRKKQHYDDLLNKIDADIDQMFENWRLSDKSYEVFTDPEVVATTRETKKAIKELFSEAKKSVVITYDATKLNTKSRYDGAAKNMEKKVLEHFLMDTTNPTYLLDTEESLEEKHHPTVIDLPYSSVIPVTIPGAPDKHIGYFILVNQWGTPLTDHVYDRSTYNGPRKLTEGAMQATFGQPAAYKYAAGINDDQRFKATTMMFGLTMRNLLNNKLEEYGFSGATIEEHEATTLCLFRYLLDRKRVGLVFVPASMMVYMAYDYHIDGTGKSRIEDLSTLLSLRTVLLISGIMAATENAIDNKVIEVDVDEKNANVTQYLAMVRDAFIEKKMLRFDNEPLTVQRDLLQRSLTLLPKNMKGLRENLNITTDRKSANAISPDTAFLEQLTNWIITGLEVPHAALNQTGEQEYSRSVATTNLMYNNKIKGEQKTTIKFGNKLIRTYLKYSSPLQKRIEEILKTSSKSRKDMKASNEAEGSDPKPLKSKQEVELNKDSIKKQLQTVIKNIKISLPAPQIVVDKAQYEEITSYADAIDRVLQMIFNENQIMDQDAKEMFTLFRETVKSDMIRDYIKQVGFQSSFDIPFPKDINIKNAFDLYDYVTNQKLKFDNFKKYVVDEARKHLEEQGDNPYGDMGGGSDMGGTTDEFGGEQPMGGAPEEGGTMNPDEQASDLDQAFDQADQGGGEQGSAPEEGGTPQEPQDMNFDETPPPPSF